MYRRDGVRRTFHSALHGPVSFVLQISPAVRSDTLGDLFIPRVRNFLNTFLCDLLHNS